MLQYGTEAASEKEIRKLVAHLPMTDNAYQEFDYSCHVSTFLA